MPGGRPKGSKTCRAAKAQAAIIRLLDESATLVVDRIKKMLESGDPEQFEFAMNHIHKLTEFGLPKLARTEIAHEGEIETTHTLRPEDREILESMGFHVRD